MQEEIYQINRWKKELTQMKKKKHAESNQRHMVNEHLWFGSREKQFWPSTWYKLLS